MPQVPKTPNPYAQAYQMLLPENYMIKIVAHQSNINGLV